jgi:chitinase
MQTGRPVSVERLLVSVFAVFVAACGSSGSHSSSSLPTATPTAATLVGALPAREDFKVVGYSPSWTSGVTSTQWDKITHVNYAFLNPNDGQTAAQVPNHPLLESLVATAHEKGKKVFLSVGGWTDQNNSAFEAAGIDTTSAATFAANLTAIADSFVLDGIDVDWEWPSTSDGTDQKYANVMDAVCAAMHARNRQCSTAVGATGASGIPSATFAYVDWFNIMVYDLGTGAEHSPYSGAVAAFDYWANRGLTSAKTNLGLPFYGRRNNWTEVATYRELVAADPSAPNNDSSNGYYYNGIPTIQKKVDLALQRGGGVMLWELSQDTTDGTSLLAAIHAKIG